VMNLLARSSFMAYSSEISFRIKGHIANFAYSVPNTGFAYCVD
jgi:hypothetical protein